MGLRGGGAGPRQPPHSQRRPHLAPLQHVPLIHNLHGKHLPRLLHFHHGNLKAETGVTGAGAETPPTTPGPRPRPGLIHQSLRPRPRGARGSRLTSLNAPRPITFRISKSSLRSRASLSLAAMGSTGGGAGRVRAEGHRQASPSKPGGPLALSAAATSGAPQNSPTAKRGGMPRSPLGRRMEAG